MNKTAKADTSAGVKPADLPAYIVQYATRATYNAVSRYFENPAVKADYEKWISKRNGVKENGNVSQ